MKDFEETKAPDEKLNRLFNERARIERLNGLNSTDWFKAQELERINAQIARYLQEKNRKS